MGPLKFLVVQAMILHPLTAPVWIAGLVELLRDREGKGGRVLGITYVVIMACMLTMHGRMYYPAPAYGMLFAAGGVAFERWFSRVRAGAWLRRRRRWDCWWWAGWGWGGLRRRMQPVDQWSCGTFSPWAARRTGEP